MMHGGHLSQRLGQHGGGSICRSSGAHEETRVPFGERRVQAGMVVTVDLGCKPVDVVHTSLIPAFERRYQGWAEHDGVAMFLSHALAANNRVLEIQMCV